MVPEVHVLPDKNIKMLVDGMGKCSENTNLDGAPSCLMVLRGTFTAPGVKGQ